MCALCGVMGGDDHWADAVARPGIFTRNTGTAERRRERTRRVALANLVLRQYGMRLGDWQGSSYMLSTATGRTEIVESLAHLWASAEKLSGRACDPLDPDLVERLETLHG
jgi:hypothetical protein